jgi:hypothetical protein
VPPTQPWAGLPRRCDGVTITRESRENLWLKNNDPSQSLRYTNGPVVKTGPTAGQNRSRNNDGTWHRKRSDSGTTRNTKEKKSGCFISTAACGLKGLADDCYELTVLRSFRDEYLLNTPQGRNLVEHYYDMAPVIASRLTTSPELERVWITIKKVVLAIETEDFKLAIELYQEMVSRLEEELDLPVSLGKQ